MTLYGIIIEALGGMAALKHIEIEKIASENQIADIMTKPLDHSLFLKQMNQLMDTGK